MNLDRVRSSSPEEPPLREQLREQLVKGNFDEAARLAGQAVQSGEEPQVIFREVIAAMLNRTAIDGKRKSRADTSESGS